MKSGSSAKLGYGCNQISDFIFFSLRGFQKQLLELVDNQHHPWQDQVIFLPELADVIQAKGLKKLVSHLHTTFKICHQRNDVTYLACRRTSADMGRSAPRHIFAELNLFKIRKIKVKLPRGVLYQHIEYKVMEKYRLARACAARNEPMDYRVVKRDGVWLRFVPVEQAGAQVYPLKRASEPDIAD
jgi:hypothetical protein